MKKHLLSLFLGFVLFVLNPSYVFSCADGCQWDQGCWYDSLGQGTTYYGVVDNCVGWLSFCPEFCITEADRAYCIHNPRTPNQSYSYYNSRYNQTVHVTFYHNVEVDLAYCLGCSAPSQICYTGPIGTENVGECKAGTQTCTNGQYVKEKFFL